MCIRDRCPDGYEHGAEHHGIHHFGEPGRPSGKYVSGRNRRNDTAAHHHNRIENAVKGQPSEIRQLPGLYIVFKMPLRRKDAESPYQNLLIGLKGAE